MAGPSLTLNRAWVGAPTITYPQYDPSNQGGEKYVDQLLAPFWEMRLLRISDQDTIVVNPDSYLTMSSVDVNSDGALTLPGPSGTYSVVGMHTKHAYHYPYFRIFTKLSPGFAAGDGGMYLGLEDWAGVGRGLLAWVFGGAVLDALGVQSGSDVGRHLTDLTTIARPADYLTAKHWYGVMHCENVTVFEVDNIIRAFVVHTGHNLTLADFVGPPWTCITSRSFVATDLSAICEIDDTSGTPRTQLINPFWIRVSNGEKVRSMVLPAYLSQTSTLMAGQVVGASAGPFSQPFPVLGFSSVIGFFNLTGISGTVTVYFDVQTQDGAWVNASTVTAATAGKYLFDFATSGGIWGRLRLQTAAGSGVIITGAEVYFR